MDSVSAAGGLRSFIFRQGRSRNRGLQRRHLGQQGAAFRRAQTGVFVVKLLEQANRLDGRRQLFGDR